MTPLKTIRENDEFSSKKRKIYLDLSNINTNKEDSIDTFVNNSNNIYNLKNTRLKLPILDSKNISSYSKMKQYKVLLPKDIKKKCLLKSRKKKCKIY